MSLSLPPPLTSYYKEKNTGKIHTHTHTHASFNEKVVSKEKKTFTNFCNDTDFVNQL